MSTFNLDYLIFYDFGMDEKEKLISLIFIALNFFKLDSLLFLIIYPNKLIILTFINPPLTWLCALGSHIRVNMTIFSFTPQMLAGWNISWECLIPLQPIKLFLWVNNEGLCHGTRVWVHLIWVITSLWFLEWMILVSLFPPFQKS